MKIGIDISPLNSGHKERGIGSYTQNLVKEFKKGEYKDLEFVLFTDPSSPPLVDLIHHPYFDLYFHTLPVKKNTSRVVTIHDVIPLIFPNRFPAGLKGSANLLLQKLSLKNVEAVICDSKTSKEDIVSNLSVPENKIHVVYLAPSTKFRKIENKAKLSKIAKKYSLPIKFVLYVGDVNWSKNIPNLLQAVKKSNVNLVMIGKAIADQSLIESKEIDKIISNLNIGYKIKKLGYIDEDELASVYNLAALTVLPSFYEGFGLPLLESMACGTPVVCSKVASLKEIGKDVAIFCDPYKVDDIAKKINSVIYFNPEQGGLQSQQLIKHASKYSWRKVAKETMKVYTSVL